MNRMVLGIFSFFTLILTVSAMNYNMPVDNNVCGISDVNKSVPCCELKEKVSLIGFFSIILAMLGILIMVGDSFLSGFQYKIWQQ